MNADRWTQVAFAFGALAALAAYFVVAPAAGSSHATRIGLGLACAGLACWCAGAIVRGRRRRRAAL